MLLCGLAMRVWLCIVCIMLAWTCCHRHLCHLVVVVVWVIMVVLVLVVVALGVVVLMLIVLVITVVQVQVQALCTWLLWSSPL